MNREFDEYLNLLARQLLKEHAGICWQYDLDLSLPAIEVVDMASCWGQWRESPPTISIATSLILNRSWDVVLNILKHEMAHQWVSETIGGKPGHGKDFKKACQIMGIPAAFCKASGDLPVPFDPASETIHPETGRLLERIRKLLALGDSTNAHESLLAIRKARQLIDRYKLDENSLMADRGCTGILINLKRKRLQNYHRAICSILQDHFQVKIVIVPLYDARDLTTYRNIDVLGRSQNVKVAEYMFHFLLDRLSYLWQARKSKGHSSRPTGRNSYWLGVVNGFKEGLQKKSSRDETTGNPSLKALTSANLPDPDNDLLLKSFIRQRHPKLCSGRRRKIRIDSSSFDSGLKDGRVLQFRPGIDCEAETQIQHLIPQL